MVSKEGRLWHSTQHSSLHVYQSCHNSAMLFWQVSFVLQYFRLVYMVLTATIKVDGPGIQTSEIFYSVAEISVFKTVSFLQQES